MRIYDIRNILQIYVFDLESRNAVPLASCGSLVEQNDDAANHALSMIEPLSMILSEIETLELKGHSVDVLRIGRLREKVMRWLGFIQGALWAMGIYTVDELRAHNKGEPREQPDVTSGSR